MFNVLAESTLDDHDELPEINPNVKGLRPVLKKPTYLDLELWNS
jgi:hypothetical protein